MFYPVYQDGDEFLPIDEQYEEPKCTCFNKYKYGNVESEKGVVAFDQISSETSQQANEDISRLWRKRKSSDPSCTKSSSKKISPDSKNIESQSCPAKVREWVDQFTMWNSPDRVVAIDCLIDRCAADQVKHMMQVIEPILLRDFITLLPKELSLKILKYLDPSDLLRASQTCRYWRFLADDSLIWREKCKKLGVEPVYRQSRFIPPISNPWKAAYMRHRYIESNWLTMPPENATILKGHDDHVITCIQFNGEIILSGSDDTTLKIWSAVTGKCLHTLVGHTGGVWSSQMNDRIVISGSTDRTLRIWDILTGKCLHTLVGHASTVRCMHLYDDIVVSGSRDSSLRVWSVEDGRCIHILVGHTSAVRCVQFNGKLIVSGAYDNCVKIWSPITGECLHTLIGHSNRVYSLRFDGNRIISGSLDRSIVVWDSETGAMKHSLIGHQSLTSGLEIRSNILVSGNADSSIKIWDLVSGRCLNTLLGPNKHQSAVTSIQSVRRFVVSSSDDGTVKLWDLHTGEFIRNLVTLKSGGSGGVVWRIRASNSMLVCAIGSRNGTEETKLIVFNFDVPEFCQKCDNNVNYKY